MSLANQLDADARTLANLRRRIPDAVRIMAALMADGYSTGRGGASGKNTISDRTSAAALANTTGTGEGYAVVDHWDALQDHARALAVTLADMLAIIERYEARLHPNIPRCTAMPTMPGYLTPLDEGGWHDPTCTKIPGRRLGLSDDCYQRYRRWCIANGCWREDAA